MKKAFAIGEDAVMPLKAAIAKFNPAAKRVNLAFMVLAPQASHKPPQLLARISPRFRVCVLDRGDSPCTDTDISSCRFSLRSIACSIGHADKSVSASNVFRREMLAPALVYASFFGIGLYSVSLDLHWFKGTAIHRVPGWSRQVKRLGSSFSQVKKLCLLFCVAQLPQRLTASFGVFSEEIA
jgi:hypothetical protein